MKIGFVLYDKALVTGISLAAEMLSGASRLRDRKTQHQDPLEIKLISTTLEARYEKTIFLGKLRNFFSEKKFFFFSKKFGRFFVMADLVKKTGFDIFLPNEDPDLGYKI